MRRYLPQRIEQRNSINKHINITENILQKNTFQKVLFLQDITMKIGLFENIVIPKVPVQHLHTFVRKINIQLFAKSLNVYALDWF